MEFPHFDDHDSYDNHHHEPNFKKSKLEDGSGNRSASPNDSEDFSILDQPQTIFRQVSNSTKLPKTAFVLYLNYYKDSYYAQHPDANFQDFQTETLLVWQSLPTAEKNVWLVKETESRKEFFKQVQAAMTEIPASSPHTLPPASPSSSSTLATATAAAVAAPVLSPSSSFLDADKKAQHSSKLAFPTFVQAMRDQVLLENPTFTYNEIQKELSKAWKNMSRDEKQIWANAVLDTPLPSMTRKTSYPRRSSSVPNPPKSAYSLFYQCARKQLLLEFPDLSGKEVPGVCSELWKNLPAAERALWQADAENDRLRYQRECAEATLGSSQIGKRSQTEKQPYDPSLSDSWALEDGRGSSGGSGRGSKQSQARKKYQKSSSSKRDSKGDGSRQRKASASAAGSAVADRKRSSASSFSSPFSPLQFPEDGYRGSVGYDYFSHASSAAVSSDPQLGGHHFHHPHSQSMSLPLHHPLHMQQQEAEGNDMHQQDHDQLLIGTFPSDEHSLKVPSHDSMQLFDDNHLAYDTLFFDSDPFHADLDFFAGLPSTISPSSTAAPLPSSTSSASASAASSGVELFHSPRDRSFSMDKHFFHEDLSFFGQDSNFSL